jgi:excisionase family DNA binding protein
MADNSINQTRGQPLDAHAVATRLGVSVFTVKREVKRGALDFYRIGGGHGRLRFSEAHVQKYLEGRENITRAELPKGNGE